jgi:RNA polymerase sigma factor (sigma-70 family)
MMISEDSIVQHLPLVHGVAYRLRRQIRCVEAEDLVSAGTVGLIEAADRFIPGRGATFASFAYKRIRGAMLDEVRHQRAPAPLSLESASDEEQTLKLIEVTEDPNSPSAPRRAELHELVAAVGVLPRSERDVLTLRLRGYRLHEIASVYDCSDSRVSQLLTQARLRLEGWVSA